MRGSLMLEYSEVSHHSSGSHPHTKGVAPAFLVSASISCKMEEIRVHIPDDVEFEDLELTREADGGVTFNVDVIEEIRVASGLPEDAFTDEDDLASLIIGWYHAHLELGGEPNAAAEELIAEAEAEDAAGQPFSLPPGRA